MLALEKWNYTLTINFITIHLKCQYIFFLLFNTIDLYGKEILLGQQYKTVALWCSEVITLSWKKLLPIQQYELLPFHAAISPEVTTAFWSGNKTVISWLFWRTVKLLPLVVGDDILICCHQLYQLSALVQMSSRSHGNNSFTNTITQTVFSVICQTKTKKKTEKNVSSNTQNCERQ